MMNREIHKLFEGAAMKGVDFYIPYLIEKTELDYRTCVALLNIYKDEKNTGYTIEEMLEPSFYTTSKMIEMVRKGYECIVPPHFYENEVFLETLEIDEIPDRLFEKNSTIESFCVNKRIKKIGIEAFKNCDNLESIVVEERDSILQIGNLAFENCFNLKNVELHSEVQISDYTFARCFKLSEIATEKIEKMGMYSFLDCISIKEVSLSKSQTIVSKGAFCGCIALKNIDLSHVERIEKDAFKNCKNLTEIDLTSVQKIEAGAFLFSPIIKTHKEILIEKK